MEINRKPKKERNFILGELIRNPIKWQEVLDDHGVTISEKTAESFWYTAQQRGLPILARNHPVKPTAVIFDLGDEVGMILGIEQDPTNGDSYLAYEFCRLDECPICDGEFIPYDFDIREGYQCWQCNQPMRIMLIYRRGQNEEEDVRKKCPTKSEFCYTKPYSLKKLTSSCGIKMEKVKHKKTKKDYFAHICSHCGWHQDDYYLVENMQQNPQFIKRIKVRYCPKCDMWREDV